MIDLYCEYGGLRRGSCTTTIIMTSRDHLLHVSIGAWLGISCVIIGGQKFVQRPSALPNYSAFTFKAVTKLRRDSVSQ